MSKQHPVFTLFVSAPDFIKIKLKLFNKKCEFYIFFLAKTLQIIWKINSNSKPWLRLYSDYSVTWSFIYSGFHLTVNFRLGFSEAYSNRLHNLFILSAEAGVIHHDTTDAVTGQNTEKSIVDQLLCF